MGLGKLYQFFPKFLGPSFNKVEQLVKLYMDYFCTELFIMKSVLLIIWSVSLYLENEH